MISNENHREFNTFQWLNSVTHSNHPLKVKKVLKGKSSEKLSRFLTLKERLLKRKSCSYNEKSLIIVEDHDVYVFNKV